MSAGRAAARGVGLVLMVVGALTAVSFGLSLLFPASGSVLGGAVLTMAGLVLAGGGYLLVRFGARASRLGVGEWMRGWFRRRGLVLFEVLVAAFGVGFAVAGYNVLSSGGDTSEVAIPLAFVPLVVAIIVTMEMSRRQASTRAQYLVIVPGFVLFGVLVVVFGATAEDLGQLAAWSVGPIAVGLSSLASGRRG